MKRKFNGDPKMTEGRRTPSHRWRVSDLLMWNNLLRRCDGSDPKMRRVMHRTRSKENLAKQEKVRLCELQVDPAVEMRVEKFHPEPPPALGETPMTRNEAGNTASRRYRWMSAPPSASRMNTKTAPVHETSLPISATSFSPFATAARPPRGNRLASTPKAVARSQPHKGGFSWWGPLTPPGERLAPSEPSNRFRLLRRLWPRQIAE